MYYMLNITYIQCHLNGKFGVFKDSRQLSHVLQGNVVSGEISGDSHSQGPSKHSRGGLAVVNVVGVVVKRRSPTKKGTNREPLLRH